VSVIGRDDPDTCTGTNTCNMAGSCKKKLGESCTPTGDECANGVCTDDHCCTQVCGTCQACTGAGGTCASVTSGEDSDTCTDGNTCDATGACKKKDGQTCAASSECLTGNCNGSYICGPSTPSRCPTLAATCGPTGTGDCCASLLVKGDTFYRSHDGVAYTQRIYPAKVSDFYLDKYEITVGRFRQFVDAGKGTQTSPPGSGGGAHPSIPGSGWNSSWGANLASTTDALKANMKCDSTYQTWTDAPGDNEARPINCLDWFTAAAFCAWDGGRLPTEAEWNYAAAGGNEQRYYPWSKPANSTTIDSSLASYSVDSIQECMGDGVAGCSLADLIFVGRKPAGNGRWGHSDLAGNVKEWNLDWHSAYPSPCNDCANLVPDANYVARVHRGGYFGNEASDILPAGRMLDGPTLRLYWIGGRCARSGP
jgi:formylglycine-generating enzyme required for sulfatase activity